VADVYEFVLYYCYVSQGNNEKIIKMMEDMVVRTNISQCIVCFIVYIACMHIETARHIQVHALK